MSSFPGGGFRVDRYETVRNWLESQDESADEAEEALEVLESVRPE